MVDVTAAANQLAAEVEALVDRTLGPLVGFTDAGSRFGEALGYSAAGTLTGLAAYTDRLAAADRARFAEATVATLDPPAAWWSTDLGRLMAAWLVAGSTGPVATVSHSYAAEVLGCARGSVSYLVARGRLASAGGGLGVTLLSVLTLAAQRAEEVAG